MPAEFLFILLGWAVPLAVAVFIVTSMVRITRSLGSIEREARFYQRGPREEQ